MRCEIKYGELVSKVGYIIYYCLADMSVEEKIEKTKRDIIEFQRMDALERMQTEEELRTLFSYDRSQLPLIEGISFKTQYVGSDNGKDYTLITKMPKVLKQTEQTKQTLDIQMTIMRIMGALGGFTYDRWGIGQPNETIKRHMNKCYEFLNPSECCLGKDVGYPKVIDFECNAIDLADNESYEVCWTMGFVIGR